MTEPDPLVQEFLVESYENLDQLDRDLVALEQAPGDLGRLASVFRTIHTIKGTCGFFGFGRLESVAHVGENLLCRLRDGELVLDPEITSALLAMVDAVRQMLARIETTGAEGEEEYPELKATLARLAARPAAGPAAPAAPPAPASPEDVADAYLRQAVRTPAAPAAPGPTPSPTPTPADNSMSLVRTTSVGDSVAGALAEGTIRVDVGLLDKLMTLVGELVLARNQILQYTAARKDAGFVRTSQRLNLITTELQEGVMKTRMQPIGTVWSKFPRVVRDLAAMCGKQVRVEMDGQGTELDKTIIEAIKDPLTHVVRNSVDHGIEPPEARAARGKPAEGRLHLRAFHEGGQVIIEITDDGGGIHPEKVKAKALERGLIDRDQAARMADRELTHLIFLPGFSTAEKVSNISGRGVGMDVVKTNIEKIGGTIDLHSRPGEGTTLRVKIPLTLAIIPALIVTTGGDRYCIPQVSLLELVRLDGDQARGGIERVHDVPVYRLRGQLLPLVDLNRRLGLGGDALAAPVVNIVVLQAEGRPFGLVVDRINDTEEIVVKPLSPQLKGIPLYSGATIMGDGRVALILDVLGLAQEGGVVVQGQERRRAEAGGKPADGRAAVRHLLLAGVGTRRLAVPLNLVARLEEIPADAVEDGGGREVVQYRGRIMPLVRLADLLGCPPGPPADVLQVVVYTEAGRSVGLVVDRILDVAEAAAEPADPGRGPGLLGSAVIQGKVTDLLDLRAVVRAAVPEFDTEEAAT